MNSRSHSSSSLGGLNENTLQDLQILLIKTIGKWAKGCGTLQPPAIDISDAIFILQALGFKISRMDATSPDDMFPLRNGERGNRVVLSCQHSGNRFFLELPLPSKTDCKCTFKVDQSEKDVFWEVTATGATNSQGESLIETGSELLPKISKEMFTVANYTLRVLIHLANSSAEFENNINSRNSSTSSLISLPLSQKTTSSPMLNNARRLSGFLGGLGFTPPVLISSPLERDSPARYRSLDTLTNNPDETNGDNTPRTPVKSSLRYSDIVQSSPNIHMVVPKQETSSGSNASTIGETKIHKVSQLLLEAMSILNGKEVCNVSEIFKNSQHGDEADPKIKNRKSTEQKNKNTVKKTLSAAKASVSSKIASVCSTQKKPGVSNTNKNPTTVISKALSVPTLKENKDVKKDVTKSSIPSKNAAVKSSKDLYSHVKSTIPKANYNTYKKT